MCLGTISGLPTYMHIFNDLNPSDSHTLYTITKKQKLFPLWSWSCAPVPPTVPSFFSPHKLPILMRQIMAMFRVWLGLIRMSLDLVYQRQQPQMSRKSSKTYTYAYTYKRRVGATRNTLEIKILLSFTNGKNFKLINLFWLLKRNFENINWVLKINSGTSKCTKNSRKLF